MICPQSSADVEPVDVRARQIQQYERGPRCVDDVECRQAGGDMGDVEVFCTQDTDQRFADSFVVLDEEHCNLFHAW